MVSGPVPDPEPDFGSESVPDQTYAVNGTVSLQLPLATGGNPPLTYSISPALPAGLTFDARARTITGTPMSAMSSTPYTYTVTDADAVDAGTDTLTFNITVTGGTTDLVPQFTGTVPNQTYGVNESVSLQLPLATGGDPPLTYSLSSGLPAGLTFNASARTITGAPTAAMESTPYTYTVTDSDATDPDSDTITFNIAVTEIPLPDTPAGLTATRESNSSVAIDWDDASHAAGYEVMVWNDIVGWVQLPAAPFTLTCPGLDPLATNPVCTDSTGTVGELTDRYYYVYVRSRNASGTSDWSSALLVNFNIPDFGPATIADQAYRVGEAITALQLPEAFGRDLPFEYTLAPALPAGLIFDAVARTITGTPTVEMSSTPYTYTVTDSDATNPDSDSLTFTVTVTGGLTPPPGDLVPDFGTEVVPDHTFGVDQEILALRLPSATGGDGTLSYTLTPALPVGLTFDAAARRITGTPTAALASTPYTYTATDADATSPDSDTLTFDLTVTAGTCVFQDMGTVVPGGDPSAKGASGEWSSVCESLSRPGKYARYYRFELQSAADEVRVDLESSQDTYLFLHDDAGAAGTTVTASELGNEVARDDDGGSGRNSRIVEQGLAAGTYTIEATTYSNARTGRFRVALTATGSGGTTDLVPAFGATVPDQTYTVNQVVSLQLPQATGGDPPLTYSLNPALPAGLTFDAVGRTITGTPTSAVSPTTYTYTVTDSDAVDPDTDALTFTITVTTIPVPPPTDSAPDFPVTVPDQTYVVDQAVSVTLPPATGGDGTLTYTLTPALPVGLSFNASTRTIAGTPTSAVSSTPYTYTVTDSDATNPDSDFLMFDITVLATLPLPDRPSGFTVEKESTSTVVIDWDDAAHAAGYEVSLWSDSAGWTPLPAAPFTLTCTGLDPAATNPVCAGSMATVGGLTDPYYYFFFRSRNASGTSTWTSSVTVDFRYPDFGSETVPDQTYVVNEAITTLELPEAVGRDVPLTYSLDPALPAGLTFDAVARTITGTPTTAVSSTSYTYTVTDADVTNPDTDTLTFNIAVEEPPTEVFIEDLLSPLYEGESDTFTVTATGLSSTVTDYEIELNAATTDSGQLRSSHGNDIGFDVACSDTSETLTIPGGSTSYTRSVTLYACSSDHGGGTVAAEILTGETAIDTHALFVDARPIIIRVEVDNHFPAPGEEISMTAVVDGPDDATFAYQWEKNSDGMWSDVSNATSPGHRVSFTGTETRTHRVVVTRGSQSWTSSSVSITSNEAQLLSEILQGLSTDLESSSAFATAQTALLTCVEGHTATLHASFAALMTEYEGGTRTAVDICADESGMWTALQDSFATTFTRLMQTGPNADAITDLLQTNHGQEFMSDIGNVDKITTIVTEFIIPAAALLKAEPQEQDETENPNAPRGNHPPSNWGLNCVTSLSEQEMADASLSRKFQALNCLTFGTPHDFWVELGDTGNTMERTRYFDAVDGVTWLDPGDKVCSIPGYDISRVIDVRIYFAYAVTLGFNTPGRVAACLKHDLAYDSLRRLVLLGNQEPGSDDIDAAWNPRNKFLADDLFLVDLECSGKIGVDRQECLMGNQSFVDIIANNVYAKLRHLGVSNVNDKNWPTTQADEDHTSSDMQYLACNVPQLTSVRIDESTSGLFNASWGILHGCADVDIESVELCWNATYADGQTWELCKLGAFSPRYPRPHVGSPPELLGVGITEARLRPSEIIYGGGAYKQRLNVTYLLGEGGN